MENNYEILPLFPLPLYIVTLPNSLANLVPELDKQPMIKNSSNNKEYGHRSKDSYLLDNPIFKDLKNTILNHVLEFSQNILGYAYEEYIFSQSWLTHKYPNEAHSPHTHPNSLISGVFYYGKFTSDTPQITFHNSSISPSHVSIIRPSTNPTIKNNYNSTEFHLKVSPGDLILFQSNLAHSVPTNTTNYIRKSLAFNIVPKNGFGDESELTELKFNRNI